MISGPGSLGLMLVIFKKMNTSIFSNVKIKTTAYGKSNGHKLWYDSLILKRDQKGTQKLKPSKK